MSEENVEILKDGFARFQEKGAPTFDMLDPEIELINFDTFPVTRRYHGWDGVVEWLVDMSDPFDDFRYELGDVLAHDDDNVVAVNRMTGTSRTGGPPFELSWVSVWTFRRGKVIRAEGFRTAEEALEAAGLSE